MDPPSNFQRMSFSSVAAAGTKREQGRSHSEENDFPALPTANRQRSDEQLLSFMSSADQYQKNYTSAATRSAVPYNQISQQKPTQFDSNAHKHSLLGLLDVIRLNSQDRTMTALGIDLTALGLNLNLNEPLNATFISPFAVDPSLGAEPAFSVPASYKFKAKGPSLLTKVASFPDETLFYIFYSMPREAVQEASAQTLYLRGWRYHKELRIWLTRDPLANSYVKGAGFERGVYIFFDPVTWSRVKKEWVLYFDNLEERNIFEPKSE